MGWRELLPPRVVGDGLIQFLYPNLKGDRDPQHGHRSRVQIGSPGEGLSEPA